MVGRVMAAGSAACLALAGCGNAAPEEFLCTMELCTSAVGVQMDDLVYADDRISEVVVCVERRCTTIDRAEMPRSTSLEHTKRAEVPIRVTVEARDKEGRPIKRAEADLPLAAHQCGGRPGCTVAYGATALLSSRLELEIPSGRIPWRHPPDGAIDVIAEGRVHRLRPRAAQLRTIAIGRSGIEIRTSPGTKRVTAVVRGRRIAMRRRCCPKFGLRFDLDRAVLPSGPTRVEFQVRREGVTTSRYLAILRAVS